MKAAILATQVETLLARMRLFEFDVPSPLDDARNRVQDALNDYRRADQEIVSYLSTSIL